MLPLLSSPPSPWSGFLVSVDVFIVCACVSVRVHPCVPLSVHQSLSHMKGEPGCEMVPLTAGMKSADNPACSGTEKLHPFGEAAEFISVADVSHCGAVITIMREGFAILGL